MVYYSKNWRKFSMKRTKIVITLGPATANKESIKALIERGVDVIRLNFSHGDHEGHRQNAQLIREVSQEIGKEIAILQDISGPKVRIGEVNGVLELQRGDIIQLSKTQHDNPRILSISYPEIIDLVNVGEKVYFADGTITSKVIAKEEEFLTLELQNDGKLTSKKGVNFPNTKLDISAITPKDEKDLIFGASLGVDLVALSFVQNKEDILKARALLQAHNSNPLLIAKIEMSNAIQNLEEIIQVSDGVMVARGDLGAEFGVTAVPRIQKRIIHLANQNNIPVITATQMLTSMIKSPYPTRAEVSDIANAVFDGTDAVMLSDETTVGEFPLHAVDVLRESVMDAEQDPEYGSEHLPSQRGDDAIAYSAVKLSNFLEDVDALIAFSASGFSAKSLAKFRPKKKIYAVTYSIETYRKLKLSWGVEPIGVFELSSPAKLILAAFDELQLQGLVRKDSKFIVTMGDIVGKKGSTNLIRVLDRDAIKTMHEGMGIPKHHSLWMPN